MDPQVPDDDRCPECGSPRLARDRTGTIYCEPCGLVLESDPIDPGPDWRAFTAQEAEDSARAGAPSTVLLHDKGLSTEMGWPGRDGQGRSIPGSDRARLYRMRTWNRRSRLTTGSDRNMARALRQIQRLTAQLGLPRSVRENAALIYKRAMESDLITGRTVEDVSAACVAIACRRLKAPRTLDEVAEAGGVTRHQVGRAFRVLVRELQIPIGLDRPHDYIPRFASRLDLDPPVRQAARSLLDQAEDAGMATGKSPTGLAAAALYVAAKGGDNARTQRDVAEASGVSEVTIRNRARDIEGIATAA